MLIENSPVAYAQNLELDAGLFQWAERTKPGRVVYISSVAAYPAVLQQYIPPARYAELQDSPRSAQLQENDINLDMPCLPDKVYGWAKLTGELLARESSVPVSVVRPFTVYGEDQDPVFPFANIMAQIRGHQDPVTVWGSGGQVRDFIHVEDVVNAILVMAEQGIDGPVNLCTGRGTSLNELIEMALAVEGYSPSEIRHLDKTEGLPYRVGNPEKLHSFYTPKICLEEGIARGLR